MEKELKIEVPQGYKIDRQKSTFEKIVFKKIHENPKTWEEYCKRTKGYTSYYGDPTDDNTHETKFSKFYNEFSTKERAKQYIALGRLLQLRDYWVEGYDKFSYIVWSDNCRMVYVCYWAGVTPYPLTFPTKEMAEEFKDCFSDLLKKAFLPERK